MPLYAGIDLHANNNYLTVIDDDDRVVEAKRNRNDLDAVRAALRPHREDLAGIAVESTFNWYWLVDGLEEAGHRVHLVNTLAAQQYQGLKYTDDNTDARWLAHMLRLGILPTGWIYPREQRAVRDLLRRRSQLVRPRTANKLTLRNMLERTGRRLTEQAVLEQAEVQEPFRTLTTIPGVGPILAATIQYETGDISRFPQVGNYASYCRLVKAEKRSNQRIKGHGLRKNGNPYLSWAFHEVAHFAVRFQPQARRWHDRKRSRTCPIVAIRALAHKLARAAYYMMRDQVPYRPEKLFG